MGRKRKIPNNYFPISAHFGFSFLPIGVKEMLTKDAL